MTDQNHDHGHKSPERVPKGYRPGTPDWQTRYDMLLPDGVTCTECRHVQRCTTLFGQSAYATRCQFHPNRFRPQPKPEALP